MLSGTSRVMHMGARRVAPRAAGLAATLMPRACAFSTTGRLSDAINVNTNPNPPLGKKNASRDTPARIALIGGRGYAGQALIDLINEHPFIDLRSVSSRELVGQELKGYTKRKIIYDNLTPEDVARLDKDGEIDCWGRLAP